MTDHRARGLEKVLEQLNIKDEDLVFVSKVHELKKNISIIGVEPTQHDSVTSYRVFMGRRVSLGHAIGLVEVAGLGEPTSVNESTVPDAIYLKFGSENKYTLIFHQPYEEAKK